MEPTHTYEIQLSGCDDATVFYMDLTDSEYKLLKLVAEKANVTSTYECMPKMFVERNDRPAVPVMIPESRV